MRPEGPNRDGLHQSGAEHGRWCAENNVVRCDRGGEVRLRDVANPTHPRAPVITKRSCTPPSGVPSGLRTEARFAYRPFAVMKDGNRILGNHSRCIRHLRIGRGARAADGRLYVASTAAVEIETRPNPSPRLQPR